MANKANTFLSNKAKRIVFVVFAFFLLYLVSYILDPFADYWVNYFHRSTSQLITEWCISFIFCFLIAESSIRIHTKLNSRLPWTDRPFRRLMTETVLNVTVVLLIIFINLICIYFIDDKVNNQKAPPSPEEIRGLLQWIVVSIIISFMIVAVNTGNFLIYNWKNASMEAMQHELTAAEHKQAAMEAELQALKLQTDPHFIFNNLSVLSELILENQQLGYEYAENISKVYRYLLVTTKKNIISLEEELKFLQSYLFLVKSRIGEGMAFYIDIDESLLHLQLPPLTLQLLVENALKHNQTTKANPLVIRIRSTSDKELIISNKIIPLVSSSASSGIGLSNIIRRYALLSDKLPEIKQTHQVFTVKIPLILC